MNTMLQQGSHIRAALLYCDVGIKFLDEIEAGADLLQVGIHCVGHQNLGNLQVNFRQEDPLHDSWLVNAMNVAKNLYHIGYFQRSKGL